MNKGDLVRRVLHLSAVAVLALVGYSAYAENITVSTYYPSPYGSYQDLEVTGTLTVNKIRGGSFGFGGMYMIGASGCMSPNPITEECSCPPDFLQQIINIAGSNLYTCYK